MHGKKTDVAETVKLPEVSFREADWGDMTIAYEIYHVDLDNTPYLKGLPDDRCQCPHWGYVVSGRMKVNYPDHEEEVGAGEAYYIAPGHTLVVEKGTELVEFSPKDKREETRRAVEANMPKMRKEAA